MIPLFTLLYGLLLVVLGLPLAAQRIAPNRLYGFRTPRTLSDERVWYPVNKVAGRDLVAAGGATVGLAGLMAIAAAISLGLLVWLLVPLTMVPTIAAILHSFLFASSYVGELDAPTRSLNDGHRLKKESPTSEVDEAAREAAEKELENL